MRGTAADVLTPTGAVVPLTASVEDAERRLLTLGAAELYVLGPAGQLAGVLPDYDLLKRRLTSDNRTPRVADLMSRIELRVSCSTPLRELALHLRQSCRSRIPVVANGRLIGEVTRTSVLRHLRDSQAVAGEDAAEPEPAPLTRAVPPAGPRFLRAASSAPAVAEIPSPGGIAIGV